MSGYAADPNAIDPNTGLPNIAMNYGTGTGYIPWWLAQAQNLNQQYANTSSLGQNLLGSLLKLTSDPVAGPLALAAFGHFGGGGQAAAQGTGGKGIASPYGGLLDQLLTGLSNSVMNPGSPFNPANMGQYKPSAAKINPVNPPTMSPTEAGKAPNEAQNWIDAYNAYNPMKPYVTPINRASGGSVVLSKIPHYIVDDKGQIVAKLTEDGAPERVSGHGVEVTPLDPVRQAQYESSKKFGGMLGELGGVHNTPGFETGGKALFPAYPGFGGGVNTAGPGTNMLPTTGGPGISREEQVAQTNPFKSTFRSGAFSLPNEATDTTTTNDPAAYAKLLGGALSAGNQAVPIEALQSLNAGLAPNQFLSANVLGSMMPSQRENYFALLQQMGLGSKEDIMDTIMKGRPAGGLAASQ